MGIGLIIILAAGAGTVVIYVGATIYLRRELKKQEDRRQLLRRLMDI